MALTEKEIAHFSDQLPKGVKVVDFREVKNVVEFVEKYLPAGYENSPYTVQARRALENFIKQVKK